MREVVISQRVIAIGLADHLKLGVHPASRNHGKERSEHNQPIGATPTNLAAVLPYRYRTERAFGRERDALRSDRSADYFGRAGRCHGLNDESVFNVEPRVVSASSHLGQVEWLLRER